MKLFKTLETNFNNFDMTVRNYLSKILGSAGAQYSHSQIFGAIFDAIKGVMQNAMFYIEDAFTEQNIDTAYRKSSIYSLAKLSGYEPYYGSAASGLICCRTKRGAYLQDKSNKIYIKNGSEIVNSKTGLKYVVYLPTDYFVVNADNPLIMNEIKVVQGVWKSHSYVAYGENLETLKITTPGLYDAEYIEVYVDGEKFSKAACLYDMTEDSKEYVASAGYDNSLDITFGNGIHGHKLSEGQSVTVRYISHSGASGNIALDDDCDLMFNDSVYDAFGNNIRGSEYLIISLSTSISGGTESDSISNVRRMVGYNSRSLVLASEDSFKLFFKRFSFIGQSNIWCNGDTLKVNAACLADYSSKCSTPDDYFKIKDEDMLLTEYQKDMVKTTLANSNKTFAGVTVDFIDPIIRRYSIIAYVKAKSGYDREAARAEIIDSIYKYFRALEPNTLFIPKSDIIKAVLDSSSSLSSFDFSFVSEANEQAKKTGKYSTYEYVVSGATKNYVKKEYLYDEASPIGLDIYGNIKISSNFEIPVISSNVTMHSDSDASIKLPAVQILFI